jgi:gluconate 2-dehydrogenase
MTRPAVLVARAIFPDVVDRLRQHFDVEDNPGDVIHP